jgi:hypothetical protein
MWLKKFEFLEQFYDSTIVLSGVYYPTSPLILHHVLEIASYLKNYENNRDLINVITPMKDKFLQYWCDIPMLYACYLTEVSAKLSVIFYKYDDKFGAVR